MLEIDQLFIYGTLLPTERNYPFLQRAQEKGLVELLGPATATGALVLHNTDSKEFPFLVHDQQHLAKLQSTAGISAHPILGRLVKILDPKFLEELDELEGVDISEFGIQSSAGPLSNIYRRAIIPVKDVDLAELQAWAYIANPAKSHTDALVKKIRTKIIVPGGNWQSYQTRRPDCSVSLEERLDHSSFGMESEFNFVGTDEQGQKRSIFRMNDGSKTYRIATTDGKRHTYSSLSQYLMQALYSELTTKNPDLRRILLHYYQRDAGVNHRSLIPFGQAYVDGEFLSFDEDSHSTVKDTIKRAQPLAKHNIEVEGICAFEPREHHLPDVDKFLETAGFPLAVRRGFATKEALAEFTRRYFLACAVENIQLVKKRNRHFGNFELSGNSSQYNYILNPVHRIDNGSVDLSAVTIKVQDSSRTESTISKYTSDVAQAMGRTFGLLLSFFLSGHDSDHVEYKVRKNNRLEYRNTTIHSIEQLTAGMAVYAAAVKTVEDYVHQRINQYLTIPGVNYRVNRQFVQKAYQELGLEQLLEDFPVVVKEVTYQPSHFRPGYQISKNDPAHNLAATDDNKPLNVKIDGKDQSMSAAEIVRKLFYNETFQHNLQQITTETEREIIRKYIGGETLTEAVEEKELQPLTNRRIKAMIAQASGKSVGDLSQDYSNYSAFVTNLMFENKGFIRAHDEEHQIDIGVREEIMFPESDIHIGSLPLTISLSKRTAAREWEKVDSFHARIDPTTVRKVIRAVDYCRDSSAKMWEVYYALK